MNPWSSIGAKPGSNRNDVINECKKNPSGCGHNKPSPIALVWFSMDDITVTFAIQDIRKTKIHHQPIVMSGHWGCRCYLLHRTDISMRRRWMMGQTFCPAGILAYRTVTLHNGQSKWMTESFERMHNMKSQAKKKSSRMKHEWMNFFMEIREKKPPVGCSFGQDQPQRSAIFFVFPILASVLLTMKLNTNDCAVVGLRMDWPCRCGQTAVLEKWRKWVRSMFFRWFFAQS